MANTGRPEKGRKDEIGSWPFIRWIASRDRWQVDARTASGGSRVYFKDKGSAEGFAQSERIKRANEGTSAFDERELSLHGWSVAMAIRFALDHLNRQAASIGVSDAITKLKASKTAAGRGKGYCDDLERRLTRFAGFAGDKKIAQFDAPKLEEFLTSLAVAPGTWNTYRRDLVTLWSYCVKAGFVTVNEAQKTERAQETDNPPEF